MKKVIREGVFETNSSSTHSVAFKKRRGNKTEKESSYELHSPFTKTLFLIGLCTHAEETENCYSFDYNEDCKFDLKEALSEDWSEELGIDETLSTMGYKGICQKFVTAVTNEYIKLSGITKEEFTKQFNESEFVYDGECVCRNFFDDDVLNDCTCNLEDYYSIAKTFKLDELNSGEDFAKKAKEFLSDDYKFVLCEFWNAFCLINSKKIY